MPLVTGSIGQSGEERLHCQVGLLWDSEEFEYATVY